MFERKYKKGGIEAKTEKREWRGNRQKRSWTDGERIKRFERVDHCE
jgi:hypothetical protein